MNEQEIDLLTQDVSGAGGKDKLIQRVQDTNGARFALQRVMHSAGLVRLLRDCLANGVVWFWGEMGIAIGSIVDNGLDEPFLFIHWFQNTAGYTIKDVVPYMEDWARLQGVTRIATAVEREGPWFELTGFSPWKLIIAKEVSNG